MVIITVAGPQGSGKTVLAEFIQRKLEGQGVPSVVEKGGNPRGPDHDIVRVDLKLPQIIDLL